MLIVKIIENNTIYSVQELHLFLCLFSSSAEVILVSFTSSIFSVHSSTNLPTIFFYTYNFHSANSHQHHMLITFTLTITWIPNKSFITNSFINQFFVFTSAFIFIPPLLIITNTCIYSAFAFTRFIPFYLSRFISS